MASDLLRTKSLDEILAAPEEGHGPPLKRSLSVWALTALGIGAIIGAGIFSSVGSAAAGGPDQPGAGPAIVLSFVLTAIACVFAGLCYAELSAMVPIAGSAYTYSYATLGELVAWIIGWDLMLEYAIGNVAVAISWSGYFQELLRGFGTPWPDWLGISHRTASFAAEAVQAAVAAGKDPLAALGAATLTKASALDHAPQLFGIRVLLDLPACLIVGLITWILFVGVRESAWFNTLMVGLKLLIIAFFTIMGSFYVKPEHWTPFAPNGLSGIAAAAAIIFFAYIGFDAVSTAAEESKNPQRDMPRAILGSLAICTVIYIAVALVLTGMVPWNQLATAEPLAYAFSVLGMSWPALVISLGAVFATTSVLLVFQLGQPRIFLSMARDGLLPKWAAKVHPKFQTPSTATVLTGILVALLATVSDYGEIVQLTNIGTFFAFVLVCIGVVVLRRRDPKRHRPFRVPGGDFLVPTLGSLFCGFLMFYLPGTSWWRFVGWLVLGAAVYCGYGWSHSVIGRRAGRPQTTPSFMRTMGVGFLAAAIGLFVIPHDAGLGRLVEEAASGAMADHARALAGLTLVVVGVLTVTAGAAMGRKRMPA